MNLRTSYLGLNLQHPIVPGASPLADSMDSVRRLEDVGAPAIVLRSLFEEQIEMETAAVERDIDAHEESFAEALSYFPRLDEFQLGPSQYLDHLHAVKDAVDIPIIASLNGATHGGWVRYAKMLEDAGADALELNLYRLAADPRQTATDVERESVELVAEIKRSLSIPLAVKLSPFYTALSNFASRLLDEAEADGLVLFNRFYQPDIDPEELDVTPALKLSNSDELRLRLRWLAILAGFMDRGTLIASGGVHTGLDAVKAIMAGAHAVQVVSATLTGGAERLADIRNDLQRWMEEHEYRSLDELRGCMSHARCPDPAGFERANYMRILQSWRV